MTEGHPLQGELLSELLVTGRYLALQVRGDAALERRFDNAIAARQAGTPDLVAEQELFDILNQLLGEAGHR